MVAPSLSDSKEVVDDELPNSNGILGNICLKLFPFEIRVYLGLLEEKRYG